MCMCVLKDYILLMILCNFLRSNIALISVIDHPYKVKQKASYNYSNVYSSFCYITPSDHIATTSYFLDIVSNTYPVNENYEKKSTNNILFMKYKVTFLGKYREKYIFSLSYILNKISAIDKKIS